MLTIGIPTYRRKELVCKNLELMKFSGLFELDDVQILVSDNASPDGTFLELQNRFGNTSITIIKNETNLGFLGNFTRLLNEAKGEYLLVTSDEDTIDRDAIPRVQKFLSQKSPRFVSTQYFTKKYPNILYRGRRSISRISPKDFLRCANYISGTIFHVRSALNALRTINFAGIEALKVYPQNLVSAMLILEGECYWWDEPVCRAVDKLETNFKNNNNLNVRWEQHLAYREFLNRLSLTSDEGKIARMQKEKNLILINTLMNSIRIECPGDYKDVESGLYRFVLRMLMRKVKNLFT